MSFANTSILVDRQVPEFIREEYPLFITFLEAYYEFLEQKQTGQKNDLTQQAKNLRYLSDIDASIEQFENNFFNTFANLLPKNSQVSKEFLIKNVLPLYLAKGAEASFKLLFRMLFNDEVEILQPRNNILRASDGKWTIDNILRIEKDVRSVYTGDGTNKEFYIAQKSTSDEISVYVNGVLKTYNSDFYIQLENKKIEFVTAPIANSSIEVFYDNFDITLLNNRKVTGLSSGASAIVEKGTVKIITDKLNFGLPYELFISEKTLIGSFANGESIETDIIGPDGNLIIINADTFSILTSIEIVDGGSNYNIGDPVLLYGGNYLSPAAAEITSVTLGLPEYITVRYGGSGFKVGSYINNVAGTVAIVNGSIDIVDTSGANAANTYLVTDDLISPYENVSISAADYGFPSNVIPTGENVNTRVIDALTSLTITDLGPITNGVIIFSTTSPTRNVALNADAPYFETLGVRIYLNQYKSVGRFRIYNGGLNYKVGDEIIFGANPPGTAGYGAAAAVKRVDANGTIQYIEVQPPRASGTANVTNNKVEIVGTGTEFGTEIAVGDKIVIRSQERYINAITSSTTANVNVAFRFVDNTTMANDCPVGSWSLGPVGGMSYEQNNFPTVSVYSANGTGANIALSALIGDGEILNAVSPEVAGKILQIKVINGGDGYSLPPVVDLTNSGDGNAIGNAQIASVYSSLPGRWTTSDSILSSSDVRLEGQDYYVDYSYVTSSKTTFNLYKNVLRELLHPAGYIQYAEYTKETDLSANNLNVISTVANTISGNVSVTNNSIYIEGYGTRFNVANSRGILTIGSNVAVNGEIRTINSIVSNSNMSVTSAFTTTANGQTLIILS